MSNLIQNKKTKRTDIFCPYCMKKYRPNNVVFRKSTGEKTVDPYLQYYFTNFRDEEWLTKTYPVIDPAFLDADALSFDEYGILRTVEHYSEPAPLRQRLCPYCHNPHHIKAGMITPFIASVIGLVSSGKTTFEAALIDSLRQDHFGALNFSFRSSGEKLETIEDNIGKLKANDMSSWFETKKMDGPYSYLLDFPDEKIASTMLTMVDLPGEYFQDPEERNMLITCGRAISHSGVCIFLVDLNQMDKCSTVLANIMDAYGPELIRGEIDFAVVLYKADKLEHYFPNKPRFMGIGVEREYAGGKPVNFERLQENSRQIETFIVKKNGALDGLNKSLMGNIHNDHLLWFAAYSIKNGQYRTNSIEEPLLWSMAKHGLYPAERRLT